MRVAALVLAACLTLPGPAVAAEAPANFVVHDTPRALPEVRFADGDGAPRTLGEFRGRTILLNLWATWCGPCRREMPTLGRLQAELGGDDFQVVALSIDRAGLEPVRKFYAEVGVENLAVYIDSTGKSARELAAVGLPTTLLIGADGREIGRLVGPAEWDEPAMVAYLRGVLRRASEG
jgi:thiol-disulfide isomerase/thioredoxin